MALNSKKIKKLSKKDIERIQNRGSRKSLYCKECQSFVDDIAFDIDAVICSRCVQKIVAPPENYKSNAPEEKRPRGWQFKTRYVSPSGKIYHKGREVDEAFFASKKVVDGDKKLPPKKQKSTDRKKRTKPSSKKTAKRRKRSG